jgi:hypothetical protein
MNQHLRMNIPVRSWNWDEKSGGYIYFLCKFEKYLLNKKVFSPQATF